MFSVVHVVISCRCLLAVQLLFAGQPIEAKTHDDVTMLFSDIVGFTSICSTATPMMVINMLQDLYNQFDVFCGQLDVYKVRH
jgi:guanylate cyclase soluble subunit alpha